LQKTQTAEDKKGHRGGSEKEGRGGCNVALIMRKGGSNTVQEYDREDNEAVGAGKKREKKGNAGGTGGEYDVSGGEFEWVGDSVLNPIDTVLEGGRGTSYEANSKDEGEGALGCRKNRSTKSKNFKRWRMAYI